MGNNSSDIRKIDQLGRVVLPRTIRDKLDLKETDSVKITLDGKRIIIEPYGEKCIFCGGSNLLLEFKGKTVCRTCLEKAIEQ